MITFLFALLLGLVVGFVAGLLVARAVVAQWLRDTIGAS